MFSPVYDQTDVNPEVGAQMAAILLMLVMPSMGTVCRLRDGNSNTATATANPFIYQKANWVPYSTQPSQLVSTDFAIFFFRNLLRTVVFHIQTTSNSAPTFIYNAVFNPLANVPTQQQLQAQGQSNMMPVWYLPAQANTVSPHGPYQFCGFDGGYRGIWVDATPVNTATITGTMTGTPSATVQGVLYRWDVSWWNPVSTGVNNVTDTITFAGIAFSGYFAVGVVATATVDTVGA